jgi:hypothetical protein
MPLMAMETPSSGGRSRVPLLASDSSPGATRRLRLAAGPSTSSSSVLLSTSLSSSDI